MAKVAGLCNRAVFLEGQDGKSILDKQCCGDASETALLKCFELEVGSIEEYQLQHPKVCEIPFNSSNKYQVCCFLMYFLTMYYVQSDPTYPDVIVAGTPVYRALSAKCN